MKAAVVGSGAWGTALAIQLCKNGHDVTMWTFEKELIPQMENERLNIRLPGVKLPAELKVSGDYACISGCKLVVMASPSFPARIVAKSAAPYIDDDAVVVSVTKGLEDKTHKRMSEVVAEATGKDVVVLTGPSHAEEVALGVATGCLAASENIALAEFVQDAFMSDSFRVYTSPDPVGITDGLNCGDNTKAMLMTRGLTETARLGVSMGAKKETFTGLSGIGDLIVTCTSMHSRNRRAGILIGQGKAPETAMEEVGAVVEGYYAAKAAYELGKRQGIDMPITTAAYKVLYEGADVKVAFSGLMARNRKAESEDTGWL